MSRPTTHSLSNTVSTVTQLFCDKLEHHVSTQPLTRSINTPSPIHHKAFSDRFKNYDIYWTPEVTLEEIEEMFGVTAKTRDAGTNTDADDMNSAEVMNKATDSEDDPEVTLTVIEGKLHCRGPSGRIRPVKATLEELKQWVKDECRDTLKKDEWMKCLMEAPLDAKQFVGFSLASCSDLASPSGLKSAVELSRNDLKHMSAEMERFKAERDEKLAEALRSDFLYWKAKNDVECYAKVISKSLEKDGES